MRDFLLVLFSFVSLSVLGQDYVHLRSGETIACKVTFIGVSVVSYRELSNMELEIEIPKSDIEEISIENGRTYKFEEVSAPPPSRDLTFDEGQKRNAVKFGLFSPAWGSFRLEYERNLRPGESLFTSMNIIGAGIEQTSENSGIGFSVGYKFAIGSPFRFYFQPVQKTRTMNGFYLMPEVAFSSYKQEYEYSFFNPSTFGTETATGMDSNHGIAFIVNLGRQYQMGDLFLLDMSFGLGYGYVDTQISRDHPGSDEPIGWIGEDAGTQMFNFVHFGNDVPIVIKTRISIGLLL